MGPHNILPVSIHPTLVHRCSDNNMIQNKDPKTDSFEAQKKHWASKAPNVDLVIRRTITRSSQKKGPTFLQKSRQAKIPAFKRHFVRPQMLSALAIRPTRPFRNCQKLPGFMSSAKYLMASEKTHPKQRSNKQTMLEPKKGIGPPRPQMLV